jgi:CRP/FNR family transcriptional regulator, cyclic AMP receptor protein
MKDYRILEIVDIFADLSEEQLELIFEICQEEDYIKGQVIFEENTPSQEIFIIMEGEVAIEVNLGSSETAPGNRGYQQIAFLERGQSFGEIALVDQGLRSATARCKSTGCSVLVINRDNFMRLLGENPKMGFIVMSNLAADLCLKIRRTTFLVRETLLYSRK